MEETLPVERDIMLQRASAALIADIENALPFLLQTHATSKTRRCVKKAGVERIIKLVSQMPSVLLPTH